MGSVNIFGYVPPSGSNVNLGFLIPLTVLITDSNNVILSSSITVNDLECLANINSNIQIQINNLYPLTGGEIYGSIYPSSNTFNLGSTSLNWNYLYCKYLNLSGLSPSMILISDSNSNVISSTISTTLLNYLSGLTSNVQSQINTLTTDLTNYLPLVGGTLTGNLITPSLNVSGLTALRVLVSDGSKNIVSSSITSTTLSYLDATSSIQSQINTLTTDLNNYLPLTGGTMTGPLTTTAITVPLITVSSYSTFQGNMSVNAIIYANELNASNLTSNRVLLSDGSNNIVSSSISNTTLAFLDATSSIQTQFNNIATTYLKLVGGTLTGNLITPSLNVSGLTALRVLVSDGSKNIVSSSITSSTLAYLDATSSIQNQFNNIATTYLPLTGGTLSGNLLPSSSGSINLGSKGLGWNVIWGNTINTDIINGNQILLINPSGTLSSVFQVGNGTVNIFNISNITNAITTLYNTLDDGSGNLTITGNFNSSGLTASKVLITDGSKNITSSSITSTTLAYLDATSSIQSQFNNITSNYLTSSIATSTYLKLVGGTLTGSLTTAGISNATTNITNSAGYVQSGSSSNTLTGALTCVAITTTGNFSQTGSTTFSTGTGAISLNGPTTIASGNSLTLNTTASLTCGTGAVNLGTGTLTVGGTTNHNALVNCVATLSGATIYVINFQNSSTTSASAVGLEFTSAVNGGGSLATDYLTHKYNGFSFTNNVYPSATNAYSCGTSSNLWTAIYATNGTIQTSDENLKTGITGINIENALNFVNNLNPVSYQWSQNSGYPDTSSTNFGICAQNIESAFTSNFPNQNCSGFVSQDATTNIYSVNFNNLLPFLVGSIQQLNNTIVSMNNTITTMQNTINELQNQIKE